ncbi:hypothetical protein SDC9_130711 [bioreactor metagenome]|uniref:Uncharacterized protein n=1 Tax=bioreactor metagenome TaxID=1076179 RepID=A0A645D4S3_9ZZZZ
MPVAVVSSFKVIELLLAVGASFTGRISTVIVVIDEESIPSLAVKVNVSVPDTFGCGTYVNAPVVWFNVICPLAVVMEVADPPVNA